MKTCYKLLISRSLPIAMFLLQSSFLCKILVYELKKKLSAMNQLYKYLFCFNL